MEEMKVVSDFSRQSLPHSDARTLRRKAASRSLRLAKQGAAVPTKVADYFASGHSYAVRAIWIFFLLVLMAVPAWAAPRVSATLSSPSIGVGESVDLEVNIEGDVRADAPAPPLVDGLDYQGASQSSQMSIIGAQVTQRSTHTFRFVARREGKFVIPSVTVTAGGQQVNTEPLTLTVKAGVPARGAGDIAFAVIEPLKAKAFVGEDIRVVIRGYLDSSVRWSALDKPQFTADGFNMRDILAGKQGEQEISGKRYVTVIYQTVVTPTKAGKLKLGGLKLRAQYSGPRGNNRYDPFPGFGRTQEMEIMAPAIEFEVLPLPSAGKPKDFAGAIGSFTFEGTGTPAKVKVGEPITMNLVVKGTGNFDRITVPPLAEPDGWNAYDSENSFTPTDQLSTIGTKTFKLPVSPLAAKTTIPVFAFTFFDPDTAKYVTLKNEATPLVVEGVPVASAPLPGGAAAPEPTPEVKSELLPNQSTPGAVGKLGQTVAPSFLFGAVLAPLPILLGLLAWRSRKADPLAEPLAVLGRERAELAARMNKTEDRAELFEVVGRILQIDAAIARREPRASFDDATILATRALDAKSDAAIRELMTARTELLFAGGGSGEKVAAVERDRVLDAVHCWERSKLAKIAVVMIVALCGAAHAGDFESANAAFANGKFEDARRGYERALSDGWRSGVLFNLGNAHYRLDQPGRAVLNYERVLALASVHPDAQANLKFVRDQAGGRVAEPFWYEIVLDAPTSRVGLWLAVGAAWLGWLWAGAALWRRSGAAGVVGGMLLVVLGAAYGAGQLWRNEQRGNDAIVIEKSDARREPADRANMAESLGAGSRVRILSEQGEWTFAMLPGGQKGWLKANAIERVIPLKRR